MFALSRPRFVLPFMLVVIIFAGLLLPRVEAGGGPTLSAWTATAPTIDGNVQAGEWASADTLPFGPFGPGNAYSGTIYMMNDGTNLYIGVILNGDDDLASDDNARFFFDNDHGAEASPEDGDDDIMSNGLAIDIGDAFYGSGTWGNWDNLNGGTEDGDARNSRQGSSNMFELSHPLDSTDDAHDFSLKIGDIVGFSFTAVVDGTWYTNIPGVGNHLNPSTYCNYVVNNSDYPDLVIAPHQIDVTVGSTFTIHIWIKNIPTGFVMTAFDFYVFWDPTMMELISHDNLGDEPGRNWDVNKDTAHSDWYECAGDAAGPSANWASDAEWATLRFRCLAEGSSSITVSGEDSVWLWDGQSPVGIEAQFDEDEIACNQRQQAPSNPYYYVGGELFSANKLAVLSPYLALFSVIAVAAVLVKRKTM